MQKLASDMPEEDLLLLVAMMEGAIERGFPQSALNEIEPYLWGALATWRLVRGEIRFEIQPHRETRRVIQAPKGSPMKTNPEITSRAWPIREGGIYLLKGTRVHCRVTAIVGNEIEHVIVTSAGGTTVEHSPRTCDADTFRRSFWDCDHSPLAALYAALRATVEATRPYHQDDTAGRPWLAEALQLLSEEAKRDHAR